MILQGAERLLKYLKEASPEVKKGFDQRIFTFDIEASNGYVIDGVARPFDYNKVPAYYNDKRKAVLCYLWQFGIDEVYFYGRHIEDLLPVWEYLATRPYTSIVWVHNFSYEFATLIGYITFQKVFARSPHKPIYAETGNLQFRCTFMLSRQKLESIGENVGFPKLVDQMEYDSIRTPESDLKPEEVDYAIRDLQILTAYVGKMKKEYEHLQKIPLTQTGRPRKDVKKIYQKDWRYHQKMTDLLPEDAKEYRRQKAAFVGGWVHANYFWVDVIIKDQVIPEDITSSYPLQMILRKFPQTPWTKCDREESFSYYLNSSMFLCLVEIEFVNVKSVKYNDYISESKAYDKIGVKHENGRIYEAEYFRLFTTCVDYGIIKDCYDVIPGMEGHIKVTKLYYSRCGYLDKRYVMYILQLYNNKVTLTNTGDPVKEELRARSKELLNSLYGLMVASLIYPEIKFDPTSNKWDPVQWKSQADLDAFTDQELEKLRQKPWKNFQSFSAGIFVTAWARRSLYDAIGHINKDVVYHDTDSVYFVGKHHLKWFEAYNEELKEKLRIMAANRDIPEEMLHPKDPNGEDQWIGLYVSDTGGKPLAEFKTLGAKRYAYRELTHAEAEKKAAKEKDPEKKKKILKKGNIKITIAGVNKKTGADAMHDDLHEFTDNMVFDYHECGKLLPHYLVDMPDTLWIDRDGKEYVSHQRCGVCLQPARYMMGMGDFLEALASMGSLSNQYSEMEIDELLQEGVL